MGRLARAPGGPRPSAEPQGAQHPVHANRQQRRAASPPARTGANGVENPLLRVPRPRGLTLNMMTMF